MQHCQFKKKLEVPLLPGYHCFNLLFAQVQMDVEVHFVQDVLHGDDTSEIRVKFIKKLEDAIPAGEE